MKHFDILLWDMDNTLLDFIAAERAAIRTLFGEFCLGPCSDRMLEEYSRINDRYWKMLERGEMTKPEILVGRFAEFFRKEGLDEGLAEEFNAAYQVRLGDTVVFNDNALELVRSLKGRIPQYIVSNGTIVAQTKKMRTSGLDGIMDGMFLSEELGFEKPAPGFFAEVFRRIDFGRDDKEKERILIVGDSLTSDITGGNLAGIPSCWYNPKHLENHTAARPDFEIFRLDEVLDLL